MSSLPTPPSGERRFPSDDLVFSLLADWVCLQASLVSHDAREPRGWQLRARRAWLRDAALLDAERRLLLGRLASLGAAVLAPYGVVVR